MDTTEQQYFQLTTVSRTEVWLGKQADLSIRKGLITTNCWYHTTWIIYFTNQIPTNYYAADFTAQHFK